MSQALNFVEIHPKRSFGITSPNEFTGIPRNQPRVEPAHGSTIRNQGKSSGRLLPAESLELANIANANNKDVALVSTTGLLSPCPYRNSGCKEMVIRGTRMEQEHCQGCDYRPVRCILHTQCEQLVPFHDFILHLTKHFLQPNYTLDLTSFVLLQAKDFELETYWSPKWLATQGHQFFLMLKRRGDGVWVSWVTMFGSEEEARCFKAKISYFRGKRFITGICPVHGIRKPESVIEVKKSCIMFTDQTIKCVSGIGRSLISDLFVNVQIQLNTLEVSVPRRIAPVQVPETETTAAEEPDVNPETNSEQEPEPETETRVVTEPEKSPMDEAYAYLMNKLKSAFSHSEAQELQEKPDEIPEEILAPIPASNDASVDSINANPDSEPEDASDIAPNEVDKATSMSRIGSTYSMLDVTGMQSNASGGFASTFGSLSLSDLDPSWYLSESHRLFQSFSSRLNDLRLQIHASLETAYEAFQEATGQGEPVDEEEDEAEIAILPGRSGMDVPTNTEVPPSHMRPRPPGFPTYQFREFLGPNIDIDPMDEVD